MPMRRITKKTKKSKSRALTTRPSYKRPDGSMWSSWSTRYGWNGRIFDPFPERLRCRLRYSDLASLTTTTGVSSPYLFSANGIYDPNVTGGGHQPYGHDTYASIYNHYQVVSSIITVSITTPFNGSLGIGISDDTSVPTGYYVMAEQKGTNIVQTSTNSANGHVRNYFNQSYYKEKKNMDALFGSNPTEQCYFFLFVRGDTSTASVTNNCTVSIEYIVDMWELQDLGQS